MRTQHDVDLPDSVRTLPRQDPLRSLTVYKLGWPFRAAYYGVFNGKATSFSSALKWEDAGLTWLHSNSPTIDPACLPLGVIWKGVMGNVGVSALLFVGMYCGLLTLRARHRIKRGKCWKCGYLSHGAAVCPECGAGVKA